MPSAAEIQAAAITGPLWTAINMSGGTRPPSPQHRHFPHAYDPAWLAALPLPTGLDRPSGQPVALLDEREEFERHYDEHALREAYTRQPRTRVYEAINRDNDAQWYAVAARHLGRLAHSHLQVVCSVFESYAGDTSLGTHCDTWYSVIIQLHGTKRWHISHTPHQPNPSNFHEITTHAGAILLLPKGLPHTVSTPSHPGHSVHLTFAIDRTTTPPPGIGCHPKAPAAASRRN
jgi:hypothetical protein